LRIDSTVLVITTTHAGCALDHKAPSELMEEYEQLVSLNPGQEAIPLPHSSLIEAHISQLYRPTPTRGRNLQWSMLMLATVLLIAGCGGGSSANSSMLLGDGQSEDPVTIDFPLAVVKRSLRVDLGGGLVDALPLNNVRDPAQFRPGAELFIRDRASPSAPETNITAGIFPANDDGTPALYDVKDLSASYDGSQLLFAMRAPRDPDLDDNEQPTWNIWLYDHPSRALNRVIESDISAEEGHDLSPRFLVDGRILFASTRARQSKAILLDEGKPQFSNLDEDRDREAVTLHVIETDGSGLKQISFNQSSDMDPAVLSDGRIVYSRWDNIDDIDRISLYTMSPDGRNQELLYGLDSHDSLSEDFAIEFMEAQELPDGRVFALLRPSQPTEQLGALPVAIDVANFSDNAQPTPTGAGSTPMAQELLIDRDLTITEATSPGGRYASIAPLYDGTNRLIVTWSQCRLTDNTNILPCSADNLAAGLAEADPLFGVWIHDLVENTQQPVIVPEEGEAFTEALVMENRAFPAAIPDGVAGLDLDADLVAEGVGVLHIRSVYDIDGTAIAPIEGFADPAQTTAADRPARFLRLVKAVSMADDDVVDVPGTAFGRSNDQLMREVMGYVPIEPDGSVKLKVPANVAFYISVVDADGKRLGGRHQNWLQLLPGEERECVGCHDPEAEVNVAHGRADAQLPSAHLGAPFDGSPYPNTEAALFANAGESMAEVNARINGVRTPSMDLLYSDIWTDPAVRAKDADLRLQFLDLQTAPPTPANCIQSWNSACRTTVNYETHIHPLWTLDRSVLAADGVTIESDNTCTSCHSPLDSAGVIRVPLAHLDLSDGLSPEQMDHFASYRELLFNDNEQEVVNGVLQDILVEVVDGDGNTVFETDEDGNLILDGADQPIPVVQGIRVNASMRVAGAAASTAFFTPFAAGASHEGYLSGVELKLISEWLDVGGQYYNNPFDVPP